MSYGDKCAITFMYTMTELGWSPLGPRGGRGCFNTKAWSMQVCMCCILQSCLEMSSSYKWAWNLEMICFRFRDVYKASLPKVTQSKLYMSSFHYCLLFSWGCKKPASCNCAENVYNVQAKRSSLSILMLQLYSRN